MRRKILIVMTGFCLLLILAMSAHFYQANDHRRLTTSEVQQLRSVFYAEVNYDQITISQTWLPTALAAYVIGNHITYRKGYYRDDFSHNYLKIALLVHEVGHVWHNQKYGNAMSAQALKEHLLFKDDVYIHEKLNSQAALKDFAYEQQGRILGDYYVQRFLGYEVEKYQAIIYKTIKKSAR